MFNPGEKYEVTSGANNTGGIPFLNGMEHIVITEKSDISVSALSDTNRSMTMPYDYFHSLVSNNKLQLFLKDKKSVE